MIEVWCLEEVSKRKGLEINIATWSTYHSIPSEHPLPGKFPYVAASVQTYMELISQTQTQTQTQTRTRAKNHRLCSGLVSTHAHFTYPGPRVYTLAGTS